MNAVDELGGGSEATEGGGIGAVVVVVHFDGFFLTRLILSIDDCYCL